MPVARGSGARSLPAARAFLASELVFGRGARVAIGPLAGLEPPLVNVFRSFVRTASMSGAVGSFDFLETFMTQRDLELAVSRVTGDSLRTIRRCGFSALDSSHNLDADAAEQEPQIVDWDSMDRQRLGLAVVA